MELAGYMEVQSVKTTHTAYLNMVVDLPLGSSERKAYNMQLTKMIEVDCCDLSRTVWRL